MEQYELHKLEKKLKKAVDAERYHHTLGVMYTAAAMAMAWGEDLERAQVAGLLHDCAKCIPNDKKVALCEKYGVPLTSFEIANPFLIHAKLGAQVARRKYDVSDPEILSSITWHTTGRPRMTLLEKIIYVADYIEPDRNKAPNLELVRKLAFTDLDECVYQILKDSMEYLLRNPASMDTTTEEAYIYYRNLHNEKEEQLQEKENGNGGTL